jgi:hypothetical protein
LKNQEAQLRKNRATDGLVLLEGHDAPRRQYFLIDTAEHRHSLLLGINGPLLSDAQSKILLALQIVIAAPGLHTGRDDLRHKARPAEASDRLARIVAEHDGQVGMPIRLKLRDDQADITSVAKSKNPCRVSTTVLAESLMKIVEDLAVILPRDLRHFQDSA